MRKQLLRAVAEEFGLTASGTESIGYKFGKRLFDRKPNGNIEPCIVVSSSNNGDLEDLKDLALVTLYFYRERRGEYSGIFSLKFRTAVDAISAVANPSFIAAMVWKGLDNLQPDDVEEAIELLADYPPDVEDIKDEVDLSLGDLGSLIEAIFRSRPL
jgi:hypothetical protein